VADASIALVSYNSKWPLRFDEERRLLAPVLAPWLEGGIHHVGSTAIPGVSAKPIIDMIAGVRDLEAARAAFEPLAALSYHPGKHRPDEAHWFGKPSLAARTHHLHLTVPGSALWRERLAFRDSLRADPKLASDYEELKLQLATEHPDDIVAYTHGKTAFIARVLAQAGIELRPK
jgi:GrpB-like predicted nucleotidyltransferase (UPF0157 family)